ncbi:DUF2808 domain-containing protein [Cyanobium sp. PCC 7001]|uniref:DUF2808 domain-containing protein n=1 Tax=Cyanobium sp. PCC 7001 TaxID=180281 RepID=UPI0002EE3C22|nr:DUF2808 domain-containing protein [Cyanobium sp. PCC 7001]
MRTGTRLRHPARVLSSIATALLAAGPLLSTVPPFSQPGQALELRGATYFQRAPWKVDLVSYNSIVGQPSARYYFTVELPQDAGASLAGLTIRQSRGVDNQFRFSPERTEAFVGRPRQEGQAIAVEASFDQRQREVRVTFPEPVAPGTTLTVMLKPWANPSVSDTYMFQVQAFPAGPNPSPASLGFATLRIYDPDWR